jgi:predicted 3-demethylubiquinone-9 3-methyltransferase (glyoxalase superfamily)
MLASAHEQETVMLSSLKIAPCLWFDNEAEQAAKFYTRIFKNSRIVKTSYYPNAGQEIHHRPAGSVLTVEFELESQPFTALNGGPLFKFNEAISLQVSCASQEEIDYYWKALSEGGPGEAQQCGWLKDKFGLSWQVVPAQLAQMISDPDKAKSERVFTALMGMKKLDLAALKKAYAG